jgi:drug/metabolite transporter (DMT)-like permease
MNANIFFLYGSTVIIWGTTWLAIKFQLGSVDPMVSVLYRFIAAALTLLLWRCRAWFSFRLTTG